MSSQGLHDSHDRLVAAGALCSNGHHDGAVPGGVNEWPSSKLHGADEASHRPEGQTTGDEHIPYGSRKAGPGDKSENGPTTDSGAAVNSFSDSPARSFTISPLGGGQASSQCPPNVNFPGSRRL